MTGLLKKLLLLSFLGSATAFGAAGDLDYMNPKLDKDMVFYGKNAGGVAELMRVDASDSKVIMSNGLISTDIQSSNMTVNAGESIIKVNWEIPGGITVTNNGTIYTVGEVTGAGSLEGTGSIISLDAGQNGDTVVFGGDVEILGTLTGGSPLEVAGGLDLSGDLTLAAGSRIVEGSSVISSGGGISLTTSDGIKTVLCTGAAVAQLVALPPSSENTGRVIRIKKTGVGSSTLAENPVTIDPNASETIDLKSTFELYIQHDAITILSDGANWIVLDDDRVPLSFSVDSETPNVVINASSRWPLEGTYDYNIGPAVHANSSTEVLTFLRPGKWYIGYKPYIVVPANSTLVMSIRREDNDQAFYGDTLKADRKHLNGHASNQEGIIDGTIMLDVTEDANNQLYFRFNNGSGYSLEGTRSNIYGHWLSD